MSGIIVDRRDLNALLMAAIGPTGIMPFVVKRVRSLLAEPEDKMVERLAEIAWDTEERISASKDGGDPLPWGLVSDTDEDSEWAEIKREIVRALLATAKEAK